MKIFSCNSKHPEKVRQTTKPKTEHLFLNARWDESGSRFKNGWGIGPCCAEELSQCVCSTAKKKIWGGKTQFGRVHLTLRKCKSNPTPPSQFEASTVPKIIINMFQNWTWDDSGLVCFTNHLVPCTSQKGETDSKQLRNLFVSVWVWGFRI